MRRSHLLLMVLVLSFGAIASAARAEGFVWKDATGETTLEYEGQPVLRYMHAPMDDSSPAARDLTYKPYHHVWSPDGKTLLTKGPGGLYPHHRGLFFGFNKVTYGDNKRCDVWHCTDGAYQEHNEEVHREADDDSAAHRVEIMWHGRGGEQFAIENRDISVYRPTHNDVAGWQIDFASHVTPFPAVPMRLDGDPQHAGFHFRASQEVADDTAKQTYYLRTDGKGGPGDYRNWDPEAPDTPVSKESENRPWNAMSMVVQGNRYTVLYLDHPTNPKPARYSERDYGRFGSYFAADVDQGKPLTVKYRLWIQPGEMTVEQCERMSMTFNAEGEVDQISREVSADQVEPVR